MSKPASRAGFIEYCKRQLGAPVLEINVADEQIEDIVDDAIQFFQERHFDGVYQSYRKYAITQEDIDRGQGGTTGAGITTTTVDTTVGVNTKLSYTCILYKYPSPPDRQKSRMTS